MKNKLYLNKKINMENETTILEETANSVKTAVKRSVLRFAWGNSTTNI